MNKLIPSSKYARQLKRYIKQQPDLVEPLRITYHLLMSHPTSARLRLHKQKGIKHIWSASVASNIRIIVAWRGNEIFLLEIGNHDQVY